MRRARAMITLVPALVACREAAGPGACAVRVEPELCQTPANPRGAERIQEALSYAAPPELGAEPLVDGRYTVTARTLYCAQMYAAPPVLASVGGVLEISGCVLRQTTFRGEQEQPLVVVWSFEYGADGTLELQRECSSEPADLLETRYGFDGSTLRSSQRLAASSPDGQAYACESVDTWELR